MLPSTNTDTHIHISICTPENAYPRFYDAILSTKYFDDETELAYYGYRYYSPEMGRWISRDPIGEWGGQNLYVFVLNRATSLIDPRGQTPAPPIRTLSPYNINIGETGSVYDRDEFHNPHCDGFGGGDGNRAGWIVQYQNLFDDYVPLQDAVDALATAVADLAGVPDDACWGGTFGTTVTIFRRQRNEWWWKVCLTIVHIDECNCECCSPTGEAEQCTTTEVNTTDCRWIHQVLRMILDTPGPPPP